MCRLNEGAFTNRLQEQPLHLPIIEVASRYRVLMREHLQIVFISSLSICSPLKLQAGLMISRTLLVCVANSSTYITMPANEGHSKFDACCRNMLTLELLHSLVPPAKVLVFTILLAKKESDLETSAADREILLPDLSVDVALKSKHEEHKAYLSERSIK
ncbi:hypothetical protein Tco_0887744 [Tanacetum coccineum]